VVVVQIALLADQLVLPTVVGMAAERHITLVRVAVAVAVLPMFEWVVLRYQIG
jgi:hypothetical protein